MIDVDDFKKTINDVHGHQVGDDVLRTLAKILYTHSTNNNSFAARYGGDEFVLVCNLTGDDARFHADAIRYAVQSYEFKPRVGDKLSNDIIRFTVSIGVAEYHGNWTAEEFLNAADKAMYQVKERGKNSVSQFCIMNPED
jgi:diguanylate cyclase (GGDEF)-like protein